MDLKRYLNPQFDSSDLDPYELKLWDVTSEDLEYVFHNHRSRTTDRFDCRPEDNLWMSIGFDKRMKCIWILFKFKNDKIFSQDFKIANEDEIRELWCEQRRRTRI